MSRAASPFAGRLYGVVRVTREWEMARSSFYYQLRIAAQPQRVLRRRGPKTECSDETLTGKIREVLETSPFYGEGHRKEEARLRMAGGCATTAADSARGPRPAFATGTTTAAST